MNPILRRKRRIDRLVWIRDLRRSQATAELARKERLLDEANRSTQIVESEADASARALARLAGQGMTAASLRAADGGLLAARNALEVARDRGLRALRERAKSRVHVLREDRQVHAAERAQERVRAEVRRLEARAEQRRIDEIASTSSARTRAARVLPLLLGAIVALADPTAGYAQAKPAEPLKAKTDATAAAIDAKTPQLQAAFSGLRTRHAELDQRERELMDRERKLADLEAAVEKRLLELEAITQEVDTRITAWEEADGGKSISRLSRIYASMPAPQAAPLIEDLDIELATQIVSKMKPKQSSALMALLSPERALEMSERIAHPLSMKPAGTEETPG